MEEIKMKKTITKFGCDGCGRENVKESLELPDGWIELKSLTLHKKIEIKLDNKEFCSQSCMMNFVDKAIMKAELFVAEPKSVPKEDVNMYFENYKKYGGRTPEELDNIPPMEKPSQQPQQPKKRGFFQ
jgi:hypothetical protein